MLGNSEDRLGNKVQAEEHLVNALRITESTPALPLPLVHDAYWALGVFYVDHDELDKADACATEMRKMCEGNTWRSSMEVRHPIARLLKGRVLCGRGALIEAESTLQLALAGMEEHHSQAPALVLKAVKAYAEVLRKLNRLVEAEKYEARRRVASQNNFDQQHARW